MFYVPHAFGVRNIKHFKREPIYIEVCDGGYKSGTKISWSITTQSQIHPLILYLPHYIFPTRSSPGLSVFAPGVQEAGQTSPPCSRTNCAACTFLINSLEDLPMELSWISIHLSAPSGSITKVPRSESPSASIY